TPQLDVSGAVEAITNSTGQGTTSFEVNAVRLNVKQGGRISTATTSVADAGSMHITSDLVSIDGGEVSSSTTAEGLGGNIDIAARGLTVSNAGKLTASTSGSGHGGAITVAANTVEVLSGGTVASDAASGGTLPGDGGTIRFVGIDAITLDKGTITSSTDHA